LCGRRRFIRSPGIVHTAWSKSISLQQAKRASLSRTPVTMMNSSNSAVMLGLRLSLAAKAGASRQSGDG
jgi:hypothetical protein